MAESFRDKVKNAAVRPAWVVVLFVDVRGFSSFCERNDLLEVTAYIKGIYARFIDDYFSSAWFVKSTGDGLLVVYDCPQDQLGDVASTVFTTCLSLVKDFESFFANDPLLSTIAPKRIGIGMSMGSACRLTSASGEILDYSGRPLNLASRLTAMARPSGVVLDDRISRTLPDNLKTSLAEETVFPDGIAESNGIQVLYTKECTTISLRYKTPLSNYTWKTATTRKFTLKSFREMDRYVEPLKGKVADEKEIILSVSPSPYLKGKEGLARFYTHDSDFFSLKSLTGGDAVWHENKKIADDLEKWGMLPDHSFTIYIEYPVHSKKSIHRH